MTSQILTNPDSSPLAILLLSQRLSSMTNLNLSILSALNGHDIFTQDLTKSQISQIKTLLNSSQANNNSIDELIRRIPERATVVTLICLLDDLNEEQRHTIVATIVKGLHVPESVNWFQPTQPAVLKFKQDAELYLLLLKNIPITDDSQTDAIIDSLSQFSMLCPWCSEVALKLQTEIVESLEPNQIKEHLHPLSNQIIQTFRNFKESSNAISRAGYKNFYNNNANTRLKGSMFSDDSESRFIWKSRNIASISKLNFLIEQVTLSDLRGQYWRVVVPSILNIIDDHEMDIKLLGVRVLSHTLLRFQNNSQDQGEPIFFTFVPFLRQTGLFQVFMDSISGMLTYLPTKTLGISSESSGEVLDVSYTVCLQLITSFHQDSKDFNGQLIALVNSNIFHSLTMVKDDIFVLSTLLSQTEQILNKLSLQMLKLLPRLIFILGNLISDPFLTSRNAHVLVSQVLQIIKLVILNCWIRVDSHRFDLLGMLIIIYQKERDIILEDHVNILNDINVCVKLLMSCVADIDAMKFDLKKLVQNDPDLMELFKDYNPFNNSFSTGTFSSTPAYNSNRTDMKSTTMYTDLTSSTSFMNQSIIVSREFSSLFKRETRTFPRFFSSSNTVIVNSRDIPGLKAQSSASDHLKEFKYFSYGRSLVEEEDEAELDLTALTPCFTLGSDFLVLMDNKPEANPATKCLESGDTPQDNTAPPNFQPNLTSQSNSSNTLTWPSRDPAKIPCSFLFRHVTVFWKLFISLRTLPAVRSHTLILFPPAESKTVGFVDKISSTGD
ncbi:hypothetical protein WICPIJ_009588 [Wickerhamomyces pijperi]|uniref:Uncharacterized protein n=1 Tax=Wickerhamomyces pijperi TaxID=599730 RepID=A0A9P8PN86_WICPI|nr:hypothetical protein WICPIJ_009588 [Wickerhamomyces pijperi]